ncbi:YciI family protein [Streptomyces sp. NPDC008092]|uniref:YciI family protein n=1 Tax=Streptomyces sp. NPDC008092 TaxID=3364808 RepID=UPI0036E9521A
MYLHVTGTVTDPGGLAAHAEGEARVLRELKADGVVLAAFRRDDGPGAFLVVEADSLQDARNKLGRLPYAAHGLLTFEYVEVSRF